MFGLRARWIVAGCGICLVCFGLVAAERTAVVGENLYGDLTPTKVGRVLWDVWAGPDGGFMAVGSDGLVVRGDENGWTELTRGLAGPLRSVWGSAMDDVFAVSSFGEILHFDGSAWQVMVKDGPGLLGVWGSSRTDVFAVGIGGAILHYDGAAWSAMDSGVETTLKAVHGTSMTNVVAVGVHGTVVRFNGVRWSRLDGAPDAVLEAVWVGSVNDLLVAGSGGVIARLETGRWVSMASETVDTILDLDGSSPDSIYAITDNHAALQLRDGTWSIFSRTPARFWAQGLAMKASGEPVLVGFVTEGTASRNPGSVSSGTGAILDLVPEVSR